MCVFLQKSLFRSIMILYFNKQLIHLKCFCFFGSYRNPRRGNVMLASVHASMRHIPHSFLMQASKLKRELKREEREKRKTSRDRAQERELKQELRRELKRGS